MEQMTKGIDYGMGKTNITEDNLHAKAPMANAKRLEPSTTEGERRMNLKLSTKDHDRLRAISTTLHRMEEHACSYPRTERAQKAADTREANLETEALEIAKRYRCRIYRQTDCRGLSLYLYRQRDLTAESKRIGREMTIDALYDRIGEGF